MDNRGFTLIELMVVIVILGILGTFVGKIIIGAPDEARQQQASIQIKELEGTIQMYKLYNGKYPTTDQGLIALVEAPTSGPPAKKWRKLLDRVPKDPWGGDYIYLCPGMHGDFDIICYGADGVVDGDGFNKDISNWNIQE